MKKTSINKEKIRILLLEGVHENAVKTFQSAGYTNIETITGSLSEEELKKKIADVHFLGIRSRTQLHRDVLAVAKKLVAVGCFCIGTNQVDLTAAREQGVVVFNAPFSNTRSVAELMLAQIIMLLRGIAAKNIATHQGKWMKSAQSSFEARGKTLGIVGYGSIGGQLSVLAESLGMKVLYHDVLTKLPFGNARQVDSLHTVLSQSDVVTMHVPEIASTFNMMGAAEFALMKVGAVFMNASRGTVVDIDALTDAIRTQHLAGVAIDVFPSEPRSNQDVFTSPLQGFDNVILTPHVGGSTLEAQANIGIEVAEKLVMFSDNGTSVSSVNFPELALPSHPGKHRILHIHANQPGMLGYINSALAEQNINISAQFLQTDETVAYVVIDVNSEHSYTAYQILRQLEATKRCRLLFSA